MRQAVIGHTATTLVSAQLLLLDSLGSIGLGFFVFLPAQALQIDQIRYSFVTVRHSARAAALLLLYDSIIKQGDACKRDFAQHRLRRTNRKSDINSKAGWRRRRRRRRRRS